MKISPARKSAFEILYKIENDMAFSSILLPIYEERLSKKDAALCHEVVLGVLRRKLYLDAIIKKLTKKNLQKFDVEVLIALRIGIYQMKFLDRIPVYSAINESVNLVKFAKKKSASGLVNAVLRKVSKKKIEIKFENEQERISITSSHPIWLIQRWINQFGIEETEKLADANNEPPRLTFRFTNKFNQQDEEKKTQILESLQANTRQSDLLGESFIANQFDENLRELAEKSFIYFQDEGSQLVAQSVDLQRDESFLDICASPGSKTSFIAKEIPPSGSENLLVAGDFYFKRVKQLQRNCKKQAVNSFELIQFDAEKYLPFEDESFSVILLDAPCTGTGTIRNNPEIRYNLCEKDIRELSDKQLIIIQNASKLLKKGGRLIYSTCSLEYEENESVIEKFLDARDGFEKVKPKFDEKFVTKQSFVRTSSRRDKTDGFFVAVLRRV